MCAQYLLPVNYLFKITHCSRKRANARNVSIENVIARRDRSRSGGGDILESRVYFYFFERTLVELFFVSYKILKKKKKKRKKRSKKRKIGYSLDQKCLRHRIPCNIHPRDFHPWTKRRIIIHFTWFTAGGRFEVDERSGVVRTRGTDLFQLDMEYVLYVKAEDQNGRIDERRYQSTPEERLSIVGGKRAPQFYMTAYEAEIPENQKKDSE